ncbi:MAG: branched-chain amino acid ABC transporter permease [Candidatus Izimaplasma sp.]|nr:branched-chain amino acid ABC transporter permease [Candidatus Izimaplasma bacterium]
MSVFISLLLRSLETGSVYALAALGVVLIFKTSKTANFAQGAIGTLNAFVAAMILVKWGWSIWAVVPIAIITAILTGFVIDTIFIRPASKVGSTGKEIITLGLIIVIIGFIPMIFGVEPIPMPKFIPFTDSTQIDILGASIGYNALFTIGLSILLMSGAFWFLKFTDWGLAIRVTASNEVVSKLMGVPTKNVTLMSWATAATFGTLAAIIIAPQTAVDINMMNDVQINAFFACVLGGFQTFYGPVIGAYLISLSKNLTAYYVTSTWNTVIVYIVIMIFLFFKPVGLVGKKLIKKV